MFRCAVAIKQRASQERRTAELNGKVYLLVDKVVKGAFVMLGFSANQDGLHCLDDVTGLATGGEGERETPDLYLPPKQRVANGCDGLIRVQHGEHVRDAFCLDEKVDDVITAIWVSPVALPKVVGDTCNSACLGGLATLGDMVFKILVGEIGL